MHLPDFFSDSYEEARKRFVAATSAMGWTLQKHLVTPTSPEGGALTIDVAISDVASKKRLVITSGLHGVEGFMGSAIQLALLSALQSGEIKLPQGCGLVLVHALNPYGFAWQRRTDHQNIDLNRNFLLEGQTYKGAPDGYAEIDAILNPSSPPGLLDPFITRLLLKVPRLGWNGIRGIIASGQYQNPHGLFFGGSDESEIKGIVAKQLPSWIPPETSAALWLDLHSGLGRRGQCMLLAADDEAKLRKNPLAAFFDWNQLVWPDKSGGTYQARGTLAGWASHQQKAFQFLFLVAEFGTLGSLRVLSALRNENRAHQLFRAGHPALRKAKTSLQEAFAPKAIAWRNKVISDSLKVFQQAVQNLDASS
jgi:predicted deacylase